MTRLEKILLAIERGNSYDPITGNVYNSKNNIINTISGNGYKIMCISYLNKKYTLYQHHFAWYYIHNEIVPVLDHINRNTLDNRLCNLRSITKQENHFNSNSKGYYYCKTRNKFVVQIQLNGKRVFMKRCDTESEAIQTHKEVKEKYHIIKKG